MSSVANLQYIEIDLHSQPRGQADVAVNGSRATRSSRIICWVVAIGTGSFYKND